MPMFGKWPKVLEVPCKRRVRGRLEDLAFAQMYWHLVRAVCDEPKADPIRLNFEIKTLVKKGSNSAFRNRLFATTRTKLGPIKINHLPRGDGFGAKFSIESSTADSRLQNA
jgi:hypothetical protein